MTRAEPDDAVVHSPAMRSMQISGDPDAHQGMAGQGAKRWSCQPIFQITFPVLSGNHRESCVLSLAGQLAPRCSKDFP